MNQDTLKNVLCDSAEFVKRAEQTHTHLFQKMAPDCKYYTKGEIPLCSFKDRFIFRRCESRCCPYIHKDLILSFEEIEGLGHS
jgi:hypothetical protein